MHKLINFKGMHEIASLSCSTFDHAKVEKSKLKEEQK
jgi:hypothetical protein